mmetsp:Transcript_9558/g.11188  ORF Transcript_9558/g.11188 Transcript_9558/m.11188 type:complete len:210 (-) Transcript_9558:518-1147(-)
MFGSSGEGKTLRGDIERVAEGGSVMISSSSSNLAIGESGIFKVDTTNAASARWVLRGAKSIKPSGSKKSLRGNTFGSRLLLLKDPSQSVLEVDCACKVVLVCSSSLKLLPDDTAVFGVNEGIDALSFLFFRGGVKEDCIISSSSKRHIDELGTVSVFTEVNKGVAHIFILQSFFFLKPLPLDALLHGFNNLRAFDAFFICLVPCLLCFK